VSERGETVEETTEQHRPAETAQGWRLVFSLAFVALGIVLALLGALLDLPLGARIALITLGGALILGFGFVVFAAIPVFAAGTGLRPEEWIALERRDLDREAGVVTIDRVYSQGRLKPCAKTSRQRRRVPLRQRVRDALEAVPPRLDSPLLFPAARGGHIDLEKFRHREWAPALRAAGLPHRRIYDLRHTYATWSLAAGVDLFTLSRRMGASLAMIDATYGHLAPDADERERGLLDAFDVGRARAV